MTAMKAKKVARQMQRPTDATTLRGGAEGKVLFLLLVCRKPVLMRNLDKDKVQVDADKERMSFKKRILDSDAFTEIGVIDSRVKAWLRSRCLPAGFLQDGLYAIPKAVVQEADEHLKLMAEERRKYARQLVADYPRLKEEAKAALGSVYVESDYPSPEALESCISLDWRFISLGTPTELEAVNEALYVEEQRKAAETWTSITDAWTQLLYSEARKLCADMVTRLEPGKRFSDESLAYLRKWTELFAERNVIGDKQLAGLVDDMRAVLKQTAGTERRLRDKEGDFRTQIQAAFAGVRDRIEVQAKSRKITFSQED